MDRKPPSFNIGDRVYLKKKTTTKNQASGTSNGHLVTELCELSTIDIFLHFENQATRKVQSCIVKDVVLGTSSRILEH